MKPRASGAPGCSTDGRDGAAARRRLQLAALAAMNLFLISPVLLYDLGLTSARGAGVDKIVLFALPASLLWLAALQLLVRPRVAHAVLFPFYLSVATDLYLIHDYRTRLTSSTLSVLFENWSDTGGYLQAHGGPVALGAAGLLAFYAAGVSALRGLELVRPRRVLGGVCAALLVLSGAVAARQAAAEGLRAALLDVASHDRSSPFGVLPQAYVAVRVLEDVLEHRQASSGFSFGATRSSTPAGTEVFVLVVGESVRRDHLSLYGYPRPTTPRLAAQPNVVAFGNVVTQAALTQIAVPLLLTRNTIDGPEPFDEPSIVSLFRELGFATHWLSTQQRDQYTGAINRYSAEAGEVRFLDRQYDGALVGLVRSALAGAGAGSKHLFVLHLQGSHEVYADRCPPGQRAFPLDPGSSRRRRLIDSYDNSIAYTDRVLAELIAVLEQQAGIAALLYVPDHGENLEDDDRGLLGHFHDNEYDLPIPLVLWYSDAFARTHPGKISAARRNARKRASTRSVFYTVADLAGARLPDPRSAGWSLLGDLQEAPRRVLGKWESIGERRTIDYDERFGDIPGAMRGGPVAALR